MKRSTNVIVSNLSRDNILFSTFYTGLFLLFRKKNWGARPPPPRPLPLLRHCNGYAKFWGVNKVNFESKDQQSLKWGGSAKRFNPFPFKFFYTIFDRKSTRFIYLALKSGAPLIYLPCTSLE